MVDKTTTIFKDETGYYREIGDTRIDCDCNGDFYVKVTNGLFNSVIPEYVAQLIRDNFTIGEFVTYADIYKKFVYVDDEYTTFKTGMYNKLGWRLTKSTNLEFEFSLQLFNIDNIVDKPIIEEI